MANFVSWWSVKAVTGVLDGVVKVAALAAALVAANFFLLRADVSYSVSAGDGVRRDTVDAGYDELGKEIPLVLMATMSDLERHHVPSRYILDTSRITPDAEILCKFFPKHVDALVGSHACQAGRLSAVIDMSYPQVLLLVNNDASFLYRAADSWAVRTHKPTPGSASEIFPEAILTPADLANAWSILRTALVDRAVVTVANSGSADAEQVRLTGPLGYEPVANGEPFAVKSHGTVRREFQGVAVGEVPTSDSFAVVWTSGRSSAGFVLAIGVLSVGLLLVFVGWLADIVHGPPKSPE